MSSAARSSVQEELWRLSEVRRQRGQRPSATAVVLEAAEAGILLGWRDVSVFGNAYGARELIAPAPHVIDFVVAYLRGRQTEQAVDPLLTSPVLLMALVAEGLAKTAKGVSTDQELLDLARALTRRSRPLFSWSSITTRDLLKIPAPDGFDLVVTAPPLGGKPLVRGYGPRQLTLIDQPSHHVIARWAEAMDDRGEIVALLADAVRFELKPDKLRATLTGLGVHLHALVNVTEAFGGRPRQTFQLAMIRRQPVNDLLIGALTPNTDIEELAANVRNHREGRTWDLGRFAKPDVITSGSQLETVDQLLQLGAKTGLPPTPLRALLLQPVPRPLRKDESWDDHPNSLYIPTLTGSHIWFRPEELSSNPSGYLQLVFDPKKALAEYVGGYLRSPLGRAMLESISSKSGGRAHLNRALLSDLAVYVPDVAAQERVLAVRAGMEDLRLQLDGLERRVIASPKQIDRISRELSRLNEKDGLKRWLDGVPFPLASVLRHYGAATTTEAKNHALLRLFEATAVFSCATMLSAFLNDSELFAQGRSRWFTSDSQEPMSFTQSTFGTWTTVGRRMAGTSRELLSDAEGRRRLLTAFRLSTPDLANGLASKRLWRVLDDARLERNAFGNGGAETDQTHLTRLRRLETLLTDYRHALDDAFEDIVLIRPGLGGLRASINEYSSAARLVGADPLFDRMMFRSSAQLEADEVYIADDAEVVADALKLVPLVRMLPAPKTARDACYFYSRVQADGEVRFVSHHWDIEAEIDQRDEPLIKLLHSLTPRDEMAHE
jgi:hypothetical protein